MNLLADNGNTALKIGLSDGVRLMRTWSTRSNSWEQIQQEISEYEIDSLLISSVAPLPKAFEAWLTQHQEALYLGPDTPLPIVNAYTSKQTLGPDRLSNAVAAARLFPKTPVLCIDMGTCIKYDFIDSQATYLGGAIAPGFEMRLNMLHRGTGALPLLPRPDRFPELIGRNTAESIYSGVCYGILAETEAALNLYSAEYAGLKAILTGGDSAFFLPKLKSSIFAVPDLSLQGLQVILRNILNEL